MLFVSMLQDENGITRPRHSRPKFFVVAQTEASYSGPFVLTAPITIIRDSLPLVRSGIHLFVPDDCDLEYVGCCSEKFGKRGPEVKATAMPLRVLAPYTCSTTRTCRHFSVSTIYSHLHLIQCR
jgi:hypothetical protein